MSEDGFEGAQAPKAIIEAPHIHIDVHVHLDGRALLAQGGDSFAPPTARRDRGQVTGTAIVEESVTRKTPWGRGVLAAAGVAIGVWLAGSVGYRVGSGAATPPSVASAKPETSGRGAEASANQTGSEMPAALARELEQKPQVTPPPGAGGPVQGPAAFGLGE
ncbi:hypothetical protein RZS28_18725 (plasmid) [Methylocapsa polymorpha]|uniref:Uncharacterized protein n=1 Tax=Methylocapsa polymorpha TaxID=3080828 RepID=A0ABZ0HWW6_9HYPH|nr:hypothetical protein RZS28_18725 [Methylocapsa sp. RX1]